ncbi:hypothetical protein VOLCADRAFT_120457 [Volvox carteri f. nagariensis]|uniref:Endonuclease/exonuclease/phosphatase domain-containing protein n=1 Tax=Volvox carteri f. nagariensis TaxID=3068 RepID=D8TLT0_VOLCA|nr:uncharacterized protein VOLCADRAFT_120457 [Volvox carteri f. nagariensis]EFJ51385.1 hypothetical protein VOLCADRAFT_120457 [Volvox carteri f. nagariensis]|eukprot:XP_002947337.1 hypothetical protein VOLCADRAFT_120457 [Volvox carteri f. nagariensis]
MTEHIDLTEDANDTSPYVTKEETSKKRIVALAEGFDERLRVAEAPARKRLRTAVVDATKLSELAAANSEMHALSGSARLSPAPPTAALPKPHSLQPAALIPAPVPTATPKEATAQTTNNLLAQLHAERISRMSEDRKAALRSPSKSETAKAGPAAKHGSSGQPSQPRNPGAAGASTSQQRASSQPASSASARSLSVLTYNLWFNEDVALLQRMRAIGDLIEREGHPDLLLFQEVTQNMLLIFRQCSWFRLYHCSPAPEGKSYFTLLLARRDTVTLPAMQPWLEKEFANSCMGRSILFTRVSVGGRPLVVGTTHLESPVGPGPQQMVSQRQEQLEVAVRELEAAAGARGDVLLAGDLNWSDTRDGPVQTPPRWCDAWQTLMANRDGNTWDPVSNPMLTSRFKGSRLDRVLCRLSASATGTGPSTSLGPRGSTGGAAGGGWQLGAIKMVGTQALPGVTYEYKGKRLPVLPSDHFGLLVKLIPTEAPPATAGVGRVLGSAAAAAAATPSASGACGSEAAAEVGASARGTAAAPEARDRGATREATGGSTAAVAGPKSGGGIGGSQLRRLARARGAGSGATAAPLESAPLAATVARTLVQTAATADGKKAAGAAPPGQRPRRQTTVDLSVDDDDDDDVLVL